MVITGLLGINKFKIKKMKNLLLILIIVFVLDANAQNYKLQTKDSLTWNNTRTTQKKSKIVGCLLEIYKKQGSGVTSIPFTYKDTDGEEYLSGVLSVSDEELNTLYMFVKKGVPPASELGYSDYEWRLYYEGFRIKMAQRLSIPPTDIELIKIAPNSIE